MFHIHHIDQQYLIYNYRSLHPKLGAHRDLQNIIAVFVLDYVCCGGRTNDFIFIIAVIVYAPGWRTDVMNWPTEQLLDCTINYVVSSLLCCRLIYLNDTSCEQYDTFIMVQKTKTTTIMHFLFSSKKN